MHILTCKDIYVLACMSHVNVTCACVYVCRSDCRYDYQMRICMETRIRICVGRLPLKCDGTRAETRFRLSAKRTSLFNPLNPELNPICYLLALLGNHHFLHVSRIRVKSLTLRRLMSYIYGAPIPDVSRSHTTTQHSR